MNDNIPSQYAGTGAPASLPLSANTNTQDLSATGDYPQPYAPNTYHPLSTPAGYQMSQPLSNSSQPSLIANYPPPPPRSTLQPSSAHQFDSQYAPGQYSLGQSPDPSRPVSSYSATNQVYSAPNLVYQAVNQAYPMPNPPYLTPIQPQAAPNQSYGASNQAYWNDTSPYPQSSGHALDRSATHIYQSPSQPSSLPTQYVTYHQDTVQPVTSQQNYNAPFLDPGEGAYTQVSPGSSKARIPSLAAGLSKMIQSKAQGYLSKIQEAQKSTIADQSFQPQPQLYDNASLSATIQQPSYVSNFAFQTTETIQMTQQQHVASNQTNSNQQNPPQQMPPPHYLAHEQDISSQQVSYPIPQQYMTTSAGGDNQQYPVGTAQHTHRPPALGNTASNNATPFIQFSTRQELQPYPVSVAAQVLPVTSNPSSTQGSHRSFSQYPPTSQLLSNSSGHAPPNLHNLPPPIATPSPRLCPPIKGVNTLPNLASRLGKMTVSDTLNPVEQQEEENTFMYDGPPIYVTPVLAASDSKRVTGYCPETRLVDYEATWYYLPATPSFIICAWCYDCYINGSPFKTQFNYAEKDQGQCRFNVPRMTHSLWPYACQTGDLLPVSQYMARRMNIPDCKKGAGAVMADEVKWFADRNKEISTKAKFVACQACYEDMILGSGFSSRFEECSFAQGPNDKWICALSLSYVQKAVKMLSKKNITNDGWAEFVATVTRRVDLPQCIGQTISASSVEWYKPRPEVGSFIFCETCYLDQLALTSYAEHFEKVVHRNALSKKAMASCDLSLTNIRTTLSVYLKRRVDYNSFVKNANSILATPRCTPKNGIVNGKWHNLKPEVGNFGICEGCYIGIIDTLGMRQFIASKPQPGPPGVELICAFNARQYRFMDYINRMSEACERRSWAAFENYVRKWAPIFNCQKLEPVSKRAWYGWPDCPICQECYETVITGTNLAQSMPLQNTYYEGQRVCRMYSPRMRAMYAAGCVANSAEALLAFSKERQTVYNQVVPAIGRIRARAAAELKMARTNMNISSQYAAADSISTSIGTNHSGYYYGGSGVGGYYTSSNAATSASTWNQAMAGFDRANDPKMLAEIRRLEAQWKAVE